MILFYFLGLRIVCGTVSCDIPECLRLNEFSDQWNYMQWASKPLSDQLLLYRNPVETDVIDGLDMTQAINVDDEDSITIQTGGKHHMEDIGTSVAMITRKFKGPQSLHSGE